MWRAIGLNLLGFGVLFALHVVFAAGEMETAFSLVAVLISLQVLTFGPLTVVLEGSDSRVKRQRTNRAAALVALPLSFGVAWAYGGMAWSTDHTAVVVGLTLFVHGALDSKLAS